MIRRRRSGGSCAWIGAGTLPESAQRNDELGTWPCSPWPEDGDAQPQKPATTSYAKTADPIVNRLAPSLVLVNFDMPYSVSGITERNYYGTGVIVDAERGLVAVDRNTVPSPIGDVRLTFAGTIEIPGRVEYLHPLHNLAMISYDPTLIGATPARAATFRAADLQPGEQVWAVGMRADGKVQLRSTTVASVDPVAFPLSRTLQFREANLETISLVNGPADYDGVLVNKNGEVVASWASFAYEAGREIAQENRGVPADLLLEMLRVVRDGGTMHSLEAELQPVPLASARKLGLSDVWVRRLEQHSPERRQILSITRLVGGSPAEDLLRSGDLLLDIDGAVVNRFREVERAVQKPQVRVTVLRDGAELAIDVPTVALAGRDLDRIWCGPAQCCRNPIARSPHSEGSNRKACSSRTSLTARRRRVISCGPVGASWRSMVNPCPISTLSSRRSAARRTAHRSGSAR